MKNIPQMPNEYLGKQTRGCGYTKTEPRKWTDEELNWVRQMLQEGYSYKDIAMSLNRSEVSVSIKLKRLGKKQNTYNKKHILEKYMLNNDFINIIEPKTILDLYCGTKSFYKQYGAITNDIDKSIEADYHDDAFRLICKMYYEKKNFDLIDLDPFGSAYDCFDLAIKMANKGLIITLGELGHKRFKRLDYVNTHYGINKLDEFTIENMIKHIQKIGLRNKKNLSVWKYKEWQNIGRVYFKIEDIKITKQWEKGGTNE